MSEKICINCGHEIVLVSKTVGVKWIDEWNHISTVSKVSQGTVRMSRNWGKECLDCKCKSPAPIQEVKEK